MAVFYKCKACYGEHRSPFQFPSEEIFRSNLVEGNQIQCPVTGKFVIVDRQDMYWKEELRQA